MKLKKPSGKQVVRIVRNGFSHLRKRALIVNEYEEAEKTVRQQVVRIVPNGFSHLHKRALTVNEYEEAEKTVRQTGCPDCSKRLQSLA